MSQYTSKGQFAKRAWQIIAPYWSSEESKSAWFLSIVIVGINLGLVYITVLLNDWSRRFYNSIQQKNYEDFKHLLFPHSFDALLSSFCGLALVFIVGAVYRLYLRQLLEIRWRNWLTKRYIDTWLKDRRYYLLQLKDFGSDNPDQRIAEDIKILAQNTLFLFLGLLSSITTLVSFFMILWNLSGPLSFSLLGSEVTIPGYMVWVAFLYAFVGSFCTHLIGRPLIRLNFDQQRYEADFRFSLIRLREHSEAIALLEGEDREKGTFNLLFGHVFTNWIGLMKAQKRLTWFTASYSQIATVFPLVVAAPRYFGGAIDLGTLMQISSAFGRVEEALSWFINSYGTLTEWKASVDRLVGFETACSEADALRAEEQKTLSKTFAGTLAGDLSLSLPDGELLQQHITFNVSPGEKVLVSGRSGKGKSTFFRTLSGLWPFAKGTMQLPNEKVLFLPQKTYLPLGSLREVLTYPDHEITGSDERLQSLLTRAGLPKLSQELDVVCDWSKRLSLGEQQRLMLIRAVLKDPKWLFMDEATASLDKRSQEELEAMLLSEIPKASIIAISHSGDGNFNKAIEFGS